MKSNRTMKLLLGLIAALLLLNLLTSLLSSEPAIARPEDEGRGRYQISAWAAVQEAAGEVKSGYYVLDTATGMVVENWIEARRR